MDKDQAIDAAQDAASAGAEGLPKPLKTPVKVFNTVIDIEQKAHERNAPARWKVYIAETGSVIAQGAVGAPLGIVVGKASAAAIAVGGPGGAFIVFYNGTTAMEGILDAVGENTYNEIMAVLNTKEAEAIADDTGDFLLEMRNGVGDFFSDIGSGISDFFGGLFGGAGGGTPNSGLMPTHTSNSTPYNGGIAGGGYTRTSTIDLSSLFDKLLRRKGDSPFERVLKEGVAEAAGGIMEQFFRGGFRDVSPVGRALVQDNALFGRVINEARTNRMETAFGNILYGKNGQMGAVETIGAQVAGNLLQAGLGELLNNTKTRTFSHESDRSRQINGDFRYSRSQQSAELLRMLQKGKRNL